MNGEITKERSVTPALQSFVSSKPKRAHPNSNKEEAPNYNATTGDALARPAASGCWPCKYQIRTKDSIRNVSCELFTQYYSPATENSQIEPSSQSQSSIRSAGRDNRDVDDARYSLPQLEANNRMKV
jgi:hypothetical protein